ncbi:hypothetical protein QJS66_22735 [Kocuria rhizophila]|nr:hypothetical protein QJS66_22735 [Kocuria rhizophila]
MLVVEGHDDLRTASSAWDPFPRRSRIPSCRNGSSGPCSPPDPRPGRAPGRRGRARLGAGAGRGRVPGRMAGREDARSGEGRARRRRARGSRGQAEEADHGTGPVPPTADDGAGGSAEDGGSASCRTRRGRGRRSRRRRVKPRLVVVWGPAGAPGRPWSRSTSRPRRPCTAPACCWSTGAPTRRQWPRVWACSTRQQVSRQPTSSRTRGG